MFQRQTLTADEIYREDIVFKDPNLQFKGIRNYQLIFWSLRFHGRLFFKRMTVDVLRIWQPEDHQIKMRWRVQGIPRVWWEAEGVIDGISTYKLDKEGVIYEHSVDNVQLRDPPITNPLLCESFFCMSEITVSGQRQLCHLINGKSCAFFFSNPICRWSELRTSAAHAAPAGTLPRLMVQH